MTLNLNKLFCKRKNTLTSLLKVRNCDNCICSDVNRASLWSSCPFKQVNTRDKNGWWWIRGAGDTAGLFCCCMVWWCWCWGVPLLLLRWLFPLLLVLPLLVLELELLPFGRIFSRTCPRIQKSWNHFIWQFFTNTKMPRSLTSYFQNSSLNSTRKLWNEWSDQPNWFWFRFGFISAIQKEYRSIIKNNQLYSFL